MPAPSSDSPLGGLSPADLLRQGAADDTLDDGGRASFVPPSPEDLATIFPQFEVLGLIGQGGMGAVYQVRQRELDRVVALKILPPAIGVDASFADRFAREAKALAKLNHPGIVTIHEFGRGGEFYFIVMEFVDGVNLRQLLQRGRISPREALAIVPQICDALQFAHDHGIVHRDIKPENLLIDRRGRVKVADFGLAKLVGGEADEAGTGFRSCDPLVTEAGKVMGTPRYMAPEQLEKPAEVDHRADIYALGVVLYQMLTGELPGERLEAPSSKVRLDVRLDEIVLRALAKEPELRFQQASVMKTRVEQMQEGLPSQKNTPKLAKLGIALQIAALLLMVMALRNLGSEPEGFQDWGFFREAEGVALPDPEPALKDLVKQEAPGSVLKRADDGKSWWISVVKSDQDTAHAAFMRIHDGIRKHFGDSLVSGETRSISAAVIGKIGMVNSGVLLGGMATGALGAALLTFSPAARIPVARKWAGPAALGVFVLALLGAGLSPFLLGVSRSSSFGIAGIALLGAVGLGVVGWRTPQGRAATLGAWALLLVGGLSVPWSTVAFPSQPESYSLHGESFEEVSLGGDSTSAMNRTATAGPIPDGVVHTADLPAGNRLQLRLVTEMPQADVFEMELPSDEAGKPRKEEIRVARDVILWDRHVERATLIAGPQECSVEIGLDDAGAQRLTTATATGHGTLRLAVIIDGKVKTAPVVQMQLGRNLQIAGFTKAEALNLLRDFPAWDREMKASLPSYFIR